MNVRDYTFDDYARLLETAVEGGYTFYTLRDYLTIDDPDAPYMVIRHDVDRRVATARAMARVEADHGVESTYYFRTSTFDPETVTGMADLGHEIGYHYEDLAKTRGDLDAAHERFAENLAQFREHADVTTICPHGSPLSPHHNLDMWNGEHDPAEYHLLGEAYLSMDTNSSDPERPSYFSDTGRVWGADVPGFGRIATTDDLAAGIEAGACDRAYLLAHPGRWSRSRAEFARCVAWDLAAEVGKVAARGVHATQQRAASSIPGGPRKLTHRFAEHFRRS